MDPYPAAAAPSSPFTWQHPPPPFDLPKEFVFVDTACGFNTWSMKYLQCIFIILSAHFMAPVEILQNAYWGGTGERVCAIANHLDSSQNGLKIVEKTDDDVKHVGIGEGLKKISNNTALHNNLRTVHQFTPLKSRPCLPPTKG